MIDGLEVLPVRGIGDVTAGDDLAALITANAPLPASAVRSSLRSPCITCSRPTKLLLGAGSTSGCGLPPRSLRALLTSAMKR